MHEPFTFENHPSRWQHELPHIGVHTHKYSRGHGLIYGGTYMTGAARLSTLACARAGAGATTVACAENVWPIYATSLVSVMVKSWCAEEEALTLLQSGHSAVLIGPGAGGMSELQRLVAGILRQQRANHAVVLDADALTVYENQAAQRSGAIVVLKGRDTVIAQPQGETVMQTASTPYLATAGSADVLAGLIAEDIIQSLPLAWQQLVAKR